MLKKVISGGQTGVDQAALRIARICGIPTGGHAPRGFRTHDGSNFELRDVYGLQECPAHKYSVRTYANVRDSDGTLRIAKTFDSPGEVCTARAITEYRKPSLSINVSYDYPPLSPSVIVGEVAKKVITWIEERELKVLNVAGNSEKTAPGITVVAEDILIEVFSHYGWKSR